MLNVFKDLKLEISTTNRVSKYIRYIRQSKKKLYTSGLEISLLYQYIHNYNKETNNTNIIDLELINLKLIIQRFINDKKYENLEILKYISGDINYILFLNTFNKKILKLEKKELSIYFRGYYINNIQLYSTDIILYNKYNSEYLQTETIDNNNTIDEFNNFRYSYNYNDYMIENIKYYFVLYDFHNIYLDYIYMTIINEYNYNLDIKYHNTSEYDKYSINDITDMIQYKLIFKHKNKNRHNSIKYILEFLFNNNKNLIYFNSIDEFKIYQIFKII